MPINDLKHCLVSCWRWPLPVKFKQAMQGRRRSPSRDSTTTKQADYVPDTLHTEQMTEQAGLNCSGHSDILLHLNALNKQVRHFTGLGNTPMTYNLRPVIEEIQRSAEDSGDKRNLKMCLGMLKSMRNRCDQNFVAYRKGLGVVCNKKGGFGVDDFVVEFFGEVYPSWRWYEKQDGIKHIQNNSEDQAPEFYNIMLERPKGDRDGYDLVFVDAMRPTTRVESVTPATLTAKQSKILLRFRFQPCEC
ncbi:Histone-lysine N-methyltransferase ATXR3 [Zea mays]|uniref:Histone-lysine N-methyltransferase ATXR3 n=1 Tax=Zea mays TaxID=4577 RepID=A0A1D6G8M1_MAIZE|nr:Histone-lysine N-methyltransferase ATXR3 [Zea mays]